MNKYMKILGKRVEDKVTGFQGVVTCVSFDLYGCVQCGVNPLKDKDGKLGDFHWFDFKRLLDHFSTEPVMEVPSFEEQEPGGQSYPLRINS